MVIGMILVTGISLTASVMVIHMAVLPLLFKYNKFLQRKMVFSNCINYPRNLDYNNPASVNIIGGKNFRVAFQSKVDKCPVNLGVWHIVPQSLFKDLFVIRDNLTVDDRLIADLKRPEYPVVLYCHGNSNHRASPLRLQMYKVFQELNFHVITFDYRGYGDSSYIRPTEKGVVEDALQVYSWLINSLDEDKKPMIIIWGHSLGTAIAANMLSNMSQLCSERARDCLPQPEAFIMEAPFNNLIEEIESHPFSKLVSWLPYYQQTFVQPFTESSEYSFTTDQYLSNVPDLPILMLHSKGDKVVPYDLAVKLFDTIKSSRTEKNAPLVFRGFEKISGLGHNNICESPELQTIIRDFLAQIKK